MIMVVMTTMIMVMNINTLVGPMIIRQRKKINYDLAIRKEDTMSCKFIIAFLKLDS